MNLDWLRTFVAAAEAENFTKAAELLHLTQPAVSQHVKELETSLKQPLFERRGRQVRLSRAGISLLPYAREMLGQWQEARTVLAAQAGQPGGAIAIGAGTTAGVYILPAMLGRFRALQPHVRLSLKIGQTSELLDLMGHGSLDLALTEESAAEGARRPLSLLPFLADELVLVGPPDGVRSLASAAALAGLPLLVRQPASRTEHLIRARLTEAGADPAALSIALELGNTEAIKRGVMAGLGYGFVSRFAVAEELAAGRLRTVPVEGLRIDRQIWLAAHARKVQPEAVARFQSFLLAEGARLAPLG